MVYRHWEYHALEYVQVDPEAHVVGPVYPVPPHCPHLAMVPVEAGVEDVAGLEELVEEDPPTEDEPPVVVPV